MAKQAITFDSGNGLNGATPSLADTKVYLNGVLQYGGTLAELNNNSVDYHIPNDTQIQLLNETSTGDILTIFHTTTSFSTGKPFLLYTDDASFSDRKVITAGDGITIDQASGQDFIINNAGLIQRSKTHVTSTAIYDTNGVNPDVFDVGAVDFSFGGAAHQYSDDRIDIFLRGTLLIKDVEYELQDVESSLGTNQFKLKGSTSIGNGDIVTAILF